jgi:GNAT superfamily N-acetyltransferase
MESALPPGLRWEGLTKKLDRKTFRSGQADVDSWLHTKALQHQDKRLSVSKCLVSGETEIAGYFTLATGQTDFGDLPAEVAKGLPRRLLPVAMLCWLGVDRSRHRQGLGRLLLAQALLDCYLAGKTFAFIAVVLDCVNEEAKRFYEQFNFAELPGRPYRLYLSFARLEAMMQP